MSSSIGTLPSITTPIAGELTLGRWTSPSLTGRLRRVLDAAVFVTAAVLFPLIAGLAVFFTTLALW